MQSDIRTLQPASSPRRSSLDSVLGVARRKARQFWITAGQRGLRATIARAAYGFLRPNRFCVFAKDIRSSDHAAPVMAGVTYAVWDAATVRARLPRMPGLPPELFQDAIDGVSLCAMALVEGQIAGFIWIYRTGDASRLFTLGAAEAELNHGAVLQPYRKMGLFRGVLTFAGAWLAERGYHTVYANVHSANAPSLKAFRNAGFSEIGSIWHIGPFRPKFSPRAR